MKTRRLKCKELPKPIKFFLFICSISIVCLPNWIALRAGKPMTDPAAYIVDLDEVLVEEIESEILLEDWMLSRKAFGPMAYTEPEIMLESWMLNYPIHGSLADHSTPGSEFRSMNLKPYSDDWLYEFDTWSFSDFRIRY